MAKNVLVSRIHDFDHFIVELVRVKRVKVMAYLKDVLNFVLVQLLKVSGRLNISQKQFVANLLHAVEIHLFRIFKLKIIFRK